MSWKTPKNYYVYIYLDYDNNPYYVGMGKGRRAIEKHLYVSVPDINYIIIEDNMTQEEAWEKEKYLIEHYGMKCKNTGPLLNLQRGGKTGNSNWHHAPETKQRISESLTGVKKTTTENYKGTKTLEHAEKIRQVVQNMWDDPEYRKQRLEKIKEKPFAHKGKPWSSARRAAQIKKQNSNGEL
jgi:hypothetical protein